MRTILPRSLRLLTVALVLILGLPGAALAGASWFQADQERYEPGDEVTLKGVTNGGAYGWIEDGPFFGFLTETTDGWSYASGGFRLRLGELTLEDTGSLDFPEVQASITFNLPTDLDPGGYFFDYCNSDCTERLGDLVGAPLFVGVDPEDVFTAEVPLEQPEVVIAPDSTSSEDRSVVEEIAVDSTEPVNLSAAVVTEDSEASSQRSRWRYGVAAAVGIAAVIVAWSVVVTSRDGDSDPSDGR